jgi:hypothetical protein
MNDVLIYNFPDQLKRNKKTNSNDKGKIICFSLLTFWLPEAEINISIIETNKISD